MEENITKLHCNWLNHLKKYITNFSMDEQQQKALCFREKLEIYSKDNASVTKEPVGSFHVSVENIGPKNQEFLVHASSSITIDDHIGGSSIISLINKDLSFLEEKRKEFIQIDDGFHEKNLHLSTGQNDYVIQVANKLPCRKEEKTIEISHDDHNIISDGCNILLMRYLAINNFDGLLSFDFITIEGKITKCNYECFCAKTIEINGKHLDACTIRQIICQDGEIIHELECIITKQGKILNLDWVHTLYMIKINPLLDPLSCDQNPIIIPLQGTWREDIEMMSKYLDEKACNIAKLEEYFLLHPHTNLLIADYIQSLLCRKPEDVITFTINHFQIFLRDGDKKN